MHIFFRYLFVASFFVGFSVPSTAQVLTVIDKETGKPIAQAAVYNDAQTRLILTDSLGRADITEFTDQDDIMIEHVAYDFTYAHKERWAEKGYRVELDFSSNFLPEVILSSSRTQRERKNIAEQVSVLSEASIRKINPGTSGELVASAPGVLLQQTQLGGGSPNLRGMEANRVLLVVDGVRLNNAIYRTGHLQNIITIDPSIMERTEVLYGASSITHGSDAVGGAIHFYSKLPEVGLDDQISGKLNLKYANAADEARVAGEVKVSLEDIAFITSASAIIFEDLRMGTLRSHGDQDWGKVPLFSTNTNTQFSPVSAENRDPNLQRNTGYRQFDLFQKIHYKINDNHRLIANVQFSNSDIIPRFDKLTETDDEGELKFAEWYYGPQRRLLSQLRYDFDGGGYGLLYDKGSISLAYQRIEESRVNRRLGSFERNFQVEDLDIVNINMDFTKKISDQTTLQYGTESMLNYLESTAKTEKITVEEGSIVQTESIATVDTRYPNDGNTYHIFGGYASVEHDWTENQTIKLGLRSDATLSTMRWRDTEVPGLNTRDGVTEFGYRNINLTFSSTYIYRPTERWRLSAVLGSGVHTPNIDDLGKVREKNGKLTVPNTSLRPETTISSELGFQYSDKSKGFYVQAHLYYARIFDYIARDKYIDPTTDTDRTVYQGEVVSLLANQNIGQAHIYGGTAEATTHFLSHFRVQTDLAYTLGRRIGNDLPLPSIPPLFGKTSFEFEYNKFEAYASARYNLKKSESDMDQLTGIDNIDQGISGLGYPGWYTLNAGLRYMFSHYASAGITIDNIEDRHYRTFNSGISAPGRNFIFYVNAEL